MVDPGESMIQIYFFSLAELYQTCPEDYNYTPSIESGKHDEVPDQRKEILVSKGKKNMSWAMGLQPTMYCCFYKVGLICVPSVLVSYVFQLLFLMGHID